MKDGLPLLVLVLQKHYRYLEAIALEHENVEDFSDLTEPDREMIARRAGPLLDQFTSMVYPEGYDPDKKPTAKRKVELDIVEGVTHCQIYAITQHNTK